MTTPSVTFTIYMIRNKFNSKCYVGMTSVSFDRRIKGHLDDTRRGSKCAIHNAFRKYGKDNFEFVVIDQSAKSWDKLCNLENYYINQYNSYKNGYNSTLGGDGKYGCHPTIETRKKISESMKGKNRYKHSIEHTQKHSKAMTGRKYSDEHKRKISAGNKGKVISAETKERMSNGQKGRIHPVNVKQKIAISKSDKTKYSFEHIASGTQEYCTRIDLYTKYDIGKSDVHNLVKSISKSAKGWRMI